MTVHQLQIGDIKCAVLQEGEVETTLDAVAARYPGASRAQVEAAVAKYPPSGSLNLLYLEAGGKRILADVGFGDNAGPPNMGGVLRGLGSLGIAPGAIDILYITHFHGDHITGLANGDGSVAFPNARCLTQKAEWDEWTARWGASDAARDAYRLALISGQRERFSFVDVGEEIAPGVTVVDLAGHTLGHTGLLLESQGERLLHAVDLLHQPFQFEHVGWHFGLDSDGAMAEATRRTMLRKCADEQLLTLFYHMPFPGLGRVQAAGAGFRYLPLE